MKIAMQIYNCHSDYKKQKNYWTYLLFKHDTCQLFYNKNHYFVDYTDFRLSAIKFFDIPPPVFYISFKINSEYIFQIRPIVFHFPVHVLINHSSYNNSNQLVMFICLNIRQLFSLSTGTMFLTSPAIIFLPGRKQIRINSSCVCKSLRKT